MTKPLAGIRVIEIGNIIAGPLCGTLLADMGADVIKIEGRGGDMSRAIPPHQNGESISFAALNRNKRSICLDLKSGEAREIVRSLAKTCDVFLENNRPGVMDKLELGANSIKAINPKIVYTSVSGYGQTGPSSRRGAVNLIAEAASGMLSVSGEPDKMPMRPGIQSADLFGALFSTYAVLCGLLGVARFGEGRVADVSLIEASIAAAAWEAAGYLATGEIPDRIGHVHRLNAPYQLFEAKDGRYVALGAPNDNLFRKLLDALDLNQHADDERFSSYRKRKQNEAAIVAIVKEAVQRLDAEEVERRLVARDVPCSIVKNFKEVLEDPHMIARNIVGEIDHPKLGHMRVTRNPVLFDHDGPSLRMPAPLLGQHTKEILTELGYSAERIDELARVGAVNLYQDSPPARASAAR